MNVRKAKDFRTGQVFGDKDQGELFWDAERGRRSLKGKIQGLCH